MRCIQRLVWNVSVSIFQNKGDRLKDDSWLEAVFYLFRSFLKGALIRFCSLGITEPIKNIRFGFQFFYRVNGVSHPEYIFEEYEKRSLEYFAFVLSRYDVFIDVGAHIGYYSLVAHCLAPSLRIVAIEANPHAYAVLQKNILVNSFQNEISCYNRVASNVAGQCSFYLDSHYDTRSSCSQKGAYAMTQIESRSDRIDSLLQDTGKSILLKIDCEGTELVVLDGCRQLFMSNTVDFFVEYRKSLYRQMMQHIPNFHLYEGIDIETRSVLSEIDYEDGKYVHGLRNIFFRIKNI